LFSTSAGWIAGTAASAFLLTIGGGGKGAGLWAESGASQSGDVTGSSSGSGVGALAPGHLEQHQSFVCSTCFKMIQYVLSCNNEIDLIKYVLTCINMYYHVIITTLDCVLMCKTMAEPVTDFVADSQSAREPRAVAGVSPRAAMWSSDSD
jgi:hypothetical protein